MMITLRLHGNKADYTIGYISMLTVRRAMDLQARIDFEHITPSQLDEIVDMIVDAFDGQFTREEFYRGIPARGFVTRLITILGDVVNLLVEAADEMGE